MARIPEEEIERLKTEVSLQRLVEAKGIELRRHGADLIGLCPFHDDKEPSFVVTPKKNLWHCLGACQAGGSVIDWVMKAEGLSFRHAVELLKQESPPIIPGPVRQISTVRRIASPLSAEVEDRHLLAQVIDYYHQALKQSPEALSYLDSRGLRSQELIERFKLGFANRTLAYRLPHKNRQAGANMRGRLTRLGIYRESGHEHFNGSLVVPIFDESGQVVEVYARKITKHLRKGTPDHLYLPGPHKGVWNVEALTTSSEIIVCESLIDAMTFWVAGFRHVTCSYGINGFTPDHVQALARYGTKRVLIAYDRDPGGDRAAKALAEELIASGIECFRIAFPQGQDANEYALGARSATSALGEAIRRAAWIGKGKQTLRQAAPVEQSEPQPPELQPPKSDAEPPPPAEPQQSQQVSSLAAEQTPPPIASPLPDFRGVEIPALIDGDEIQVTLGDRRWRVRGVSKNTSFDSLRCNVLVAVLDAKGKAGDFHIDILDLYSARARATFTKAASEELRISEDIVKADLGKVLLAAEQLAADLIQKTLEPAANAVALTEAEHTEAMELLRDPNLLDRILSDFELCGVVGEEENKLIGYLAAASRKLDEPLAVILQSSSAAGKSSLMESVLSFVPEEDRVKYSAMTGQSLFYMGESDLAHKVLAIVEEQGAERAAYALKLLQSEGELSIASTGKDATTGRLVTHTYEVKGPVAIILTTTAVEVDEELLSRCIVLTVDEDREQTQAIHRLQRESQTLEGLLEKAQRARILKVHQNAQRLLKPVLVANPYARYLTFADERTRNRRDHMKYLTLIRSVALVHQHQRPRRTITHDGASHVFIEVTLDDIRVANRLAHEVLGRSLDELAPQTRRLLTRVDEMVSACCQELATKRADFRFTRKDVRRATGWSEAQVRVHIERLVDLEYLLVHRGGRGQSFVYELLFDGEGGDGRPHLIGLIDPDQLEGRFAYDEKFEGQEGDFVEQTPEFVAPTSPQSGPNEGGSRAAKNGQPPALLVEEKQLTTKNHFKSKDSENASYINEPPLAEAAQ